MMRFPLLLAVLCLLGALRAAETAPAARPNILWLVTEDTSATFHTGYGDPLARTPVFDRIAKSGVLFERAYSTSAVCAPTRASIITGMYAPALGTQHMRSNVPMPDWLRYFPAYLRDAGYYTTNRAKTDYNAAVLPGTWDQNGNQAHWRNRQPGQPFFAVFNTNASHESSLHKRVELVTDPAKVRVPAYLPDTPEVRADLAQYYDRVAAADRACGEVLAQLEADGLADNTIIFHYSDHGGVLTRSKRFLFEGGTHPPLAVSFPPKYRHLAPGAPGSRSTELVNWVDLAPTVLSVAGVTAPAHLQGRAFAGPARAPAPAYTFNFRDRMDEAIDFSRAVTDGRFRYIRNYRPEQPILQHVTYLWNMATTRELDRLRAAGQLNAIQAALFAAKPAEQLFDCQTDPDNVRNLAADPAHRATLEKMRAANRGHLLRIRDSGFMPESLLRARAAGRPPVLVARDDAAYPLARIIDTVDRLQLGAAPTAAELAPLLRDPDAVIRFWAAHAVLSRRVAADVSPLLRDPVPIVRLVAAAALAGSTDAAKAAAAWPIFAAALEPTLPAEVKLEALSFLTALPARPASLRPLIEAAAKPAANASGENYAARAAEHLLKL
ncbi:MAG: hypothetical protein B9S34_06085 [Opitutia bacterium Tous-C1TDCM]|nr:MAG: hypothetical protein B9S34_06085 [Opitutae bacterium Tous-C1TDCM]